MTTRTCTPRPAPPRCLRRSQQGFWRRVRDRWRGEDGSLAILMVVAAFALLLAIGLGVDGSRKSSATSDATAIAEEAARAGGQALLLEDLATGQEVGVDPQRAVVEAQNYLSAAGATGTVTVNGSRLIVEASITKPTLFLGMMGIHTVTGSGRGAADLISTG